MSTYAATRAAQQRRAYLENCRDLLKPIDYRRADCIEAYEAGVPRDRYMASVAAHTSVGMALEALRPAIMASAEREANRIATQVLSDLASVDWVIDETAPFPDFEDRKRRSKRGRYDLFHSLTRPNALREERVEPDPEAIYAFIEQAARIVSLQFDDILIRLVREIGNGAHFARIGTDVDDPDASLCMLLVCLDDGRIEHWEIDRPVEYTLLGNPRLRWQWRKL